MPNCSNCGATIDSTDRFCRKCGKEIAITPSPAPGMTAPGQPRQRKKRLVGVIAIANVVLVGGFVFMMNTKGCSSVEGSFIATGDPLGSFTFTPEQCRAGQRMSFFGAGLLGKDQNSGAVLVIEDAVRGKIVKVEVPGTCTPPDYEVCKVVEITPDQCQTFKLSVRNTGALVNEIRLTEGTLNLDCKFKQGGTARADIKFSRCD